MPSTDQSHNSQVQEASDRKRMMRLVTVLVPFVTALWLSPASVVGKKCGDVCFDFSDEEPCVENCQKKQRCECCYEWNPRQESLSTLKWWENTDALEGDSSRLEWFRKRQVYEPIVDSKERNLVAGVLYTHSQTTLKMTVLFPPLYPEETRQAAVFVIGTSTGKLWEQTCNINDGTWHCTVRFDSIPHTESYVYEVQYTADSNHYSSDYFYNYGGSIPMQKDYPRIAGVGCFGKDSTKNKDELRDAIIAQDPDILVLQGDQTYFHTNLLYGFLETIYAINDLTRNIPTIVQLDDHDYGQGNIWGAWDDDEDSGAGFDVAPCVVNAVQDLSIGHLPDPGSDQTLDNGIKSYYTNYIYGKTDLAIMESRKFKNRRNGDSLFGSNQEAWVQEWCEDQERLKVILLQTPISLLATNSTRNGKLTSMRAVIQDVTTPGRDRFMSIIKDCTQLLLSGDQHLGIAVTYDQYGMSECASPAASNDMFWRLNSFEEGKSHMSGDGMQYTLHKVWNVKRNTYLKYENAKNTRLVDNDVMKKNRADGFLMVDLDGTTATCEMHSYRVSPEKVWEVSVPAVDRRRR
ncbi:PhoD-like phosphatase [Nitzschia inconspicua]|uniref:PhoD-like phosphatase n=1 Tax=Nitzschia inconspicua TaxID=303405 RepID=A0A9K3LGA3_9STRA|nr:PhoD-like phosphatase [Nitzschia inconspicua]